jgi:hypothetical protein
MDPIEREKYLCGVLNESNIFLSAKNTHVEADIE